MHFKINFPDFQICLLPGAGSLIADCFRTDTQSTTTNYAVMGFTAWSPRNTYAWSMQLVCLLCVVMWALLYKYMVPCKHGS